MASIRRTLSPVPRPGALMNEACQVASPLSKSSSNSQNYPPRVDLLSSSFDYALYKARNFVLGFFSGRSSWPFDRTKLKGQIWRRGIFHFLMCFIVGLFIGLASFVSLNTSFMSKRQSVGNDEFYIDRKNDTAALGEFSLSENVVPEPKRMNIELKDGDILNNTLDQASNVDFDKLLIIVTPTFGQPLQIYYMNRLAHTLKRVPHPLLWIVVEMNSQSMEVSELLRKTGVMYRHLVCSVKNSTANMDKNALLRNVALSHIEKHRLDGIVYFADDNQIYSTDLFDQMRQISRFGTWIVAKLEGSEGSVLLEGPTCNGSQVTGWHVVDMAKRYRRFHAIMSGFAFNSTIIWDPKRWHRPTLEPIRLVETAKEDIQASAFIEQIVEDESQMECFSTDSSEIMVWQHTTDSHSYPLAGLQAGIWTLMFH